MKFKWCCAVDQLALPVATVVSQNLLLKLFFGFLLRMASVWRLLRAPICKFTYFSSSYFRALSLSLDTYKYINFNSFFICFCHLKTYKPISHYKQIEWKKYGNYIFSYNQKYKRRSFWTWWINIKFLFFFISFHHLTRHKPISYYKHIELKNVVTNFFYNRKDKIWSFWPWWIYIKFLFTHH